MLAFAPLQRPRFRRMRFVRSTSVFLTILAMLIGSFAKPPAVQAQSSVCGLISSNVTWTPAGSPYIVTCNVQVILGVTLAVQPGVVIKFDEDTGLQVDGELIARGATFTTNDSYQRPGAWGQILFTASSVDAEFTDNGAYVSGSAIQDSFIEWSGGGSGISGAIETNSASPFIDHNTIRNSRASGIHAVARSATEQIVISRNSVTGNDKNGNGGGIFVSSGIVVSNTINNNHASNDGGGIYTSDSTLIGNQVSANSTSNHGGGVYASGSVLTKNIISGNTTTYESGGGVYANGGKIEQNTIMGNVTNNAYGENGGGVFIQGGELTDNLISGNTANGLSLVQGGGVYASSSTVIGNEISNNTASVQFADEINGGGGIYAEGGIVSDNAINGNAAVGAGPNHGGGLFIVNGSADNNTIRDNSAQHGGGVYAIGAEFKDNEVTDNRATAFGGGVYALNSTTATRNVITGNRSAQGGGVYSNDATFNGNEVRSNQATAGAGVYAEASTVRGNTLAANHAEGDGGGLYMDGGLADSNWIFDNSVPTFGHGSGVYLAGAPSFSYNNVITNTASGGTAGGVSVAGQPVLLEYNNIYNNQPYEAEVVGTGDVQGLRNYWGNVPCTAIAGVIYDGADAPPNRGLFSYAPSLYEPAPLTQLRPVSGLNRIDEDEMSVTLAWNAVDDIANVGCRPDGENAGVNPIDIGYRLYYDNDEAGPPYDGQGLAEGDSPIDVGESTSIRFVNLPHHNYHFAVSVYDYLGRESIYTVDCLGSECGTPQPALVLIYAVLDNNLGDDPEAWMRLVNNAERGMNKNVNVRLFVDGPDHDDAYVYDIQHDERSACPSLHNPTCDGFYTEGQNFWIETEFEDAAHPETLYYFVEEALAAYPAISTVALSLVGHGAGWTANALPGQPSKWGSQPGDPPDHEERVGGLLWDDTPGNGDNTSRSMSTKALGIAMDWIADEIGAPIDLFYLDACSMGMAEVAYEIRDHADYLLASPNTAWSSFAYDDILQATNGYLSGQQIGEAWLNAEATVLDRRGYPFTLSLIELGKMADLTASSSAFADMLQSAGSDKIGQAFANADHYESDYDGALDNADNYVDMSSFATQIKAVFSGNGTIQSAAQTLANMVEDAVVKEFSHANGEPWEYPGQQWAWDDPGGLSVYLPLAEDEAKRALYTGSNLKWAADTTWDEFLAAFWGVDAAAMRAYTDELPTCASTRNCEELAEQLALEMFTIYLPTVPNKP